VFVEQSDFRAELCASDSSLVTNHGGSVVEDLDERSIDSKLDAIRETVVQSED
jgi:hypothetical protein